MACNPFQEAIQLSEEKFCPVWAIVKNNVEVVTKKTRKKTGRCFVLPGTDGQTMRYSYSSAPDLP